MSIFSRFFGRKEKQTALPTDKQNNIKLVANKQITNPLALIVLFPDTLNIDADILKNTLNQYHSSMANAQVDIDPELNQSGTLFGLVGWQQHVIQLVGFNAPIPNESLENCIQAAYYADEYKQQAYQHQSNIILYYAGYETDPIEQYVALTAVAGTLSQLGAITIINETAHTSLPATIFSPDNSGSDTLEIIKDVPLLMLFCGVVKYQVEGIDGVWLRTHGAHLLGLPDLAVLLNAHDQTEYHFELLSNLYSYLRSSQATFSANDTMQVGDDKFMRLRLATEDEYFLENPSELFVIEFINASEVNH